MAHHRLEDKVKENGDQSGYHLIVLAKTMRDIKISLSWYPVLGLMVIIIVLEQIA